jgi:hypothetical protein
LKEEGQSINVSADQLSKSDEGSTKKEEIKRVKQKIGATLVAGGS